VAIAGPPCVGRGRIEFAANEMPPRPWRVVLVQDLTPRFAYGAGALVGEGSTAAKAQAVMGAHVGVSRQVETVKPSPQSTTPAAP
jgi:hypothetical protein